MFGEYPNIFFVLRNFITKKDRPIRADFFTI